MAEHLPPEFNGGVITTITPLPAVGAVAPSSPGVAAAAAPPVHEPVPLAEMEKRHIRYVLDFVKGNKLKAAGLLGISRTTLYEKLKQYELGGSGEDEKNE